jgi:predicted aldo/keto reductase-like oxidoreductase
VQSGKVRYIGFSEWPLDRIEAALELKNVVRFVSSQPQYSLLHREPEKGLLALCAKAGISQGGLVAARARSSQRQVPAKLPGSCEQPCG